MSGNPFRKRWAVVMWLPVHGRVGPTMREVSRHWFHGMAEERVAELEGRRGGGGQAYASGILSIEALS